MGGRDGVRAVVESREERFSEQEGGVTYVPLGAPEDVPGKLLEKIPGGAQSK